MTEEMVSIMHSAAIGYYHTINADMVLLQWDPKKEGNALKQLHERLRAGLIEIFK